MRRRPWPERAGEAQCLGGCLGKPGDCVSSPTLLLYACRSRESISSICRLPRERARHERKVEAVDFSQTLPNCYSIAGRTVAASRTVVPARDQKGTRCVCASTPCRGCPRNCKRRVCGQTCHWEFVCSWEGGRRQRSASQDICHRQRSRASASGGVSRRERRVRLLRVSVEGDDGPKRPKSR